MESLPATTPQPTPPAPTPQPQNEPHSRRGKVARLPKKLRDQINFLILDGVPYLDIIQRLNLAAHGITDHNLTTWKSGGHRDFLRNLLITEAIQSKYELAQDIIERSGDGNEAGQALLHVMATNLCEFLADTDPTTLRESVLSDADKFTKFVNSMVRLAEGGIKCELHKFRTEERAAQAAKANTPPEKRGISEEALRLAEEKLKLM